MSRRGLTVIELLIALTVTGVVLALAADAIRTQTRAHLVRGLAVQRRAGLASAGELLAHQLRASDAQAGDLALVGDTALDILAPMGGAAVCAAATDRIVLAPPDPADPAPLRFGVDDPEPGDALFVLSTSAGAPAWLPLTVISVDAAACPASRDGIDAAPGTQLHVAPPLADSSLRGIVGTPVRYARWRRWGTYQAADGQWWLGERPCISSGVCGGVQPAAGPLDRSARGLRFEWDDSAGVPAATATPPAAMRSVVIHLRAAEHALLAGAESLSVRIARRGTP